MNSIIQQFNNSHRILVVTHANPDGDAIGSLIAMGLSLEALNKKITLYCESLIPAVYRFLPGVHRVVNKIGNLNYDMAVILDCGDLGRVGQAAASFIEQILKELREIKEILPKVKEENRK